MALVAAAHAMGAPVAGGQVRPPTSFDAAPRAGASEAGTPDALVISNPRIDRRKIRPGQTVTVSMLLRNQGPPVARSQAPAPSTVYSQGDTFEGKGFEGGEGRYFIAMSLSGPRGDTWPFRWGVGGDLPLGVARRVSFPIRFTEPGRYDIFIGVGVGVGDRVEWRTRVAGVEVVPEGERLVRTPNTVRPAPVARFTVNGEPVESDQRPILREARFLVPVRFLMEHLGARVDWDPAAKRVTARRGSYSAVMEIGENYARVGGPDGEQVHLFPAPLIKDGRTMVPLRFVTEALGGTTGYNIRTKTIAVTVPALPGAAAVAAEK